MKRKKILNIIDKLFLGLIIFFTSFVWLRYFVKDVLPCALFAGGTSLLIVEIINAILTKKSQSQLNNQKIRTHIEQCAIAFFCSSKQINIQFFKKIFADYGEVIVKNNFLIVNAPKKIAVCLCFDALDFNVENLIKTYVKVNNLGVEKAVVLCLNTTPETLEFANTINNINIKIFDKEKIYNDLLAPKECYPKQAIELKKQRRTELKKIVNIAFNRKKARTYFLYALLILFCSIFVRFKIYYYIFSTILLLTALFCFFNKRFNLKKDGILD